ncbi:hypothetical protein [Herbiconiux sp. UC225_62]|uniref:hypothetical protein n=1 Tax=Herbiconiux sp. UC225_62 TaxID=3350168 RepID=UPI0036D35B6F
MSPKYSIPAVAAVLVALAVGGGAQAALAFAEPGSTEASEIAVCDSDGDIKVAL